MAPIPVILIIVAVVWGIAIVCTLLVLPALMRSSQLASKEEQIVLPESKRHNSRPEKANAERQTTADSLQVNNALRPIMPVAFRRKR